MRGCVMSSLGDVAYQMSCSEVERNLDHMLNDEQLSMVCCSFDIEAFFLLIFLVYSLSYSPRRVSSFFHALAVSASGIYADVGTDRHSHH
jgi:hypothetical protein